MKKRFAFVSGLAFLFMASVASAGDFYAGVYRLTNTSSGGTELTQITTGITYHANTVNTDTLSTMTKYGDRAATSKTNPVTTTVFATDGEVKFRVADTTSVDLVVTDTAGGYSATVEGFSTTDHRVVIDERANESHYGIYRFACTSTAETDSGIDFAYDSFVEAVQVDIVDDDGDRVDVGLLSSETSGDADGFIVDYGSGSGGTQNMTLGSSGALLDNGTNYYPQGHFITGENARSLTFTCGGGPGTTKGYIHYRFSKVR